MTYFQLILKINHSISAEVSMNNLLDPEFWDMFNLVESNKVNLVVWFFDINGNEKGHNIKSVNIEQTNLWYKLESSFDLNNRPIGTYYVAIDIWPSALGPQKGQWWFDYYNLYVKDIKVIR